MRQGLIQEAEDICGLGATGITSNTALFQQFVRWMNKWNKIGANYAILAFDGHDFDDPNYTTAPTGTFAGTTTRDYNFDPIYAMLKIKLVNISFDGTNYVPAYVFDDADRQLILEHAAVNDPNIDGIFATRVPAYDLIASGFKIYPKFTAAQVSAGAKIYVEWFRYPREFATTGTDTYVPGFDFQFHQLPAIGASYEWAKIYKPALAPVLKQDLYGDGNKEKGILTELEEWYSAKSPSNVVIRPNYSNPR